MNFSDAKNNILQILSRTDSQDLTKLISWMKHSDDLDNYLVDNQRAILQSIADDLRCSLPLEAMFPSETMAIQKTQHNPKPTMHVDAFLYDEENVDSLCEEGKMSRNFCLSCGSHRTAPMEFISHSFSISELQFLFLHVLPDLSGKLVVDVGSRLGAVLYGGYLYSMAAQLVGVEICEEFVKLQTMTMEKYGFSDRIQVIHADICSQAVLLQNADVLIMNNVFEYFMDPKDQVRAWQFISQNFLKKGALLVTVPSIQEALMSLQETNDTQQRHQQQRRRDKERCPFFTKSPSSDRNLPLISSRTKKCFFVKSHTKSSGRTMSVVLVKRNNVEHHCETKHFNLICVYSQDLIISDIKSEFFERTILCNSLVWSCAVTGKPGLTYQEALESEKKAKLNLKSFPKALLLPLLHLTALTQRTRLHEICDDVCAFIKERFFPGEMVDVVSRSGARQHCQILEVIPPHSNGTANGHAKHRIEGDSIVISDSDDEIMVMSPKATPSGRKRKAINPSMFKYKVQLVSPEGSEPIIVKSSQIV
ncbi:hypothetical protein QTP86_018217 [Hemibagrus guttatus]|nr:hypothetical protein QTP86_018217 [Hemibagrus guttatus]